MHLSRIRLAPELANLIPLEDFIRSCDFLDGTGLNRCLLIATEYFDNIARYSKRKFSRFFASPVEITVVRRDLSDIPNAPSSSSPEISIRLRYGTRNFSEMIRAIGTTSPHYDVSVGRYRGLGLRMCGNLASSIRYKKGLFKSSIIIIL